MDEAANETVAIPEPNGEAVNQADIEALISAAGAEVPPSSLPAAETPAPASDPAPPIHASTDSSPVDPQPLALTEFDTTDSAVDAKRVSMLHDVNLRVKIELGRSWMLVEDVLRLGEGSVVELDKLAGDPVDVFVNDRLIARGEVLVLNDSFCVRVTEVLSNDPHRVSA